MALQILSQRAALVDSLGLMRSGWFTLMADIVRAINRLDSGSATTIKSASFTNNPASFVLPDDSSYPVEMEISVLESIITGAGLAVSTENSPDYFYFSGLELDHAYQVSVAATFESDTATLAILELKDIGGSSISVSTASYVTAAGTVGISFSQVITGTATAVLYARVSDAGGATVQVGNISFSIFELGTAV